MDMVKVTVAGVYQHQDGEAPPQHFVLFRDNRGRRLLLWVGQFEAWYISFALDGESSERPFTHDAVLTFLEATGASLEKVWITEVREETFYALAFLRVGQELKEIDIRPSDAVALALRATIPIYIAEQVMSDYQIED